MELKFLTPTEVWEGYDPSSAPLETTVIGKSENGNLLLSKYYFTAEIAQSGRLRAYVEVLSDKRWTDKRPVALIIPALDNPSDYSYIEQMLVAEGYIAAVVDYASTFTAQEEHTSFPAELGFAHHDKCRESMMSITSSARETPWFVWTKIVRRAITLLGESRNVDVSRIGILGIGTGAHLTWLVAGTDNRVKAAVPIDAGGYLWCQGIARFGGDSVPKTDEERAFSTGVGAETYARFVNCPVLFTASSNSDFFDIDRAGDTLALLPSCNKHLVISRNTNQQLSKDTFLCIRAWLKKYFAHDDEPEPQPIISFEESEGKLFVKLNTQNASNNITVCAASAKFQSTARSWRVLTDKQKVGDNQYLYYVPVADADNYMTAFASVGYGDDLVFSSPVIAVLPSKMGIKSDVQQAKTYSHIIYTNAMGLGNFSIQSKDLVVDEDNMHLVTGPHNIKGIATTRGALVLFRREYDIFPEDRNTILQLDAYFAEPKTIFIKMLSTTDCKYYNAKINLKGGQMWQKISVSTADFKSDDGRTLTRFADAQKLLFDCAENVAFNNLLWV